MPKHNSKRPLMNQTLCSHSSYKTLDCGKEQWQTPTWLRK